MKVEIRDITKEEAVPYGDNADIVLAERKAVVFTDDAGNTGKLYMKEEDVELLGEQYIAENSKMEYSEGLQRVVSERVVERIQERPDTQSAEDH